MKLQIDLDKNLLTIIVIIFGSTIILTLGYFVAENALYLVVSNVITLFLALLYIILVKYEKKVNDAGIETRRRG